MQYTVERLLDVARGVGVFHINRFALIDRRPPEEQKAHPFVPRTKGSTRPGEVNYILTHFCRNPEFPPLEEFNKEITTY